MLRLKIPPVKTVPDQVTRGRSTTPRIEENQREPSSKENAVTLENNIITSTSSTNTRSEPDVAIPSHDEFDASARTRGSSRYDKVQLQSGGVGRFRHPMATYSVNEAVETVLNDTSNLMYNGDDDIDDKKTNPRTRASISLGNDLIPAFNGMSMDLDSEEREDEQNGLRTDRFDNRFDDQSRNLETNQRFLNTKDHQSYTGDQNGYLSNLNSSNAGRIQQRITFLKQVKEEEHDLTNSLTANSWRNASLEQRVAFDYLKNELRCLRRYNYKPLVNAVERVNENKQRSEQVLNSDASVTSNYIFKIYSPLDHIVKHPTKIRDQESKRNQIQQISKEETVEQVEQSFRIGRQISEELWENDFDVMKVHNGNKSSTDTSNSTISGTDMSLKLAPDPRLNIEMFKKRELDAINEKFDGYEFDTAPTGITYEAEDASPLS